MGKSYKAAVNVACLKQHTCVGCQSKFAYVLERQVTSEAPTEAAAVELARQRAAATAANEIDFHACPECGLVQPEMVADARYKRFLWAAILGTVALFIALMLGLAQVVPIATSATLAIAAGALTLILNAWGSFYNPNRNLEANRMASQAKLDAGTMLSTEKSTLQGVVHDEHGGLSAGQIVALGLIAAAIVAAAAPLLLCQVKGWTRNATCYPAVCGPGDKTCFYFSEKITSLKGYWAGEATGLISNARELNIPNPHLHGETKMSQWGQSISGKSVSNETKKMWAEFVIPREDLEGETLQLELTVAASYPIGVGGRFTNEHREFRHETTATLSSPFAGRTYRRAWQIGQCAALAMFVVAGVLSIFSTNALRGKGNPTQVASLQSEAPTEGRPN